MPINKSPNRVALILGSDKLTQEAQNALLKTLEEPPKDTVIILTAAFDGLLLPTIRSRVQILHVVKPDESLLREHFNSSDEQNFNRAYLISGGLPGLLSALLQNEDHPLISATDNAREILSKNQYERLLLINDLSKDTTKLLKYTANYGADGSN